MSKAWIVLTTADINDYLVGAQANALRTAALATGQEDPLAEAIVDISAEIRNNIRACSSNVLSATEGSIPPELKRHACALIIEAAQPRIKLKLSDDQKDAAENARKLMLRIASCNYPISEPIDPQTQPTDQGSGNRFQVASSRPRIAKGSDLDGL
ncbi:MAG: hypothetical protein AAF065_11925 [Verrucomicrobiota bacterium]